MTWIVRKGWESMTRAKKLYGIRQTAVVPVIFRSRLGRPKGSRKKRRFEQTRLGFFLMYETPAEYSLIMQATAPGLFPAPSADLIGVVAAASTDPAFGKPKFARYLSEYRKWGIFPKRAKKMTPVREAYYVRLRDQKARLFLRCNRKRIREMMGKRGLFV